MYKAVTILALAAIFGKSNFRLFNILIATNVKSSCVRAVRPKVTNNKLLIYFLSFLVWVVEGLHYGTAFIMKVTRLKI